MSDHYLRLIPADPHWRATPDAASTATRLLAEMLPAVDDVRAAYEDGIVFYDAGQNTERIECPACGAGLDDWWGEAMGKAYATGFHDLAVVTPCCSAKTSLNDLVYVWPAAFGAFALEARNPGLSTITDSQRTDLERALGSPLKIVWQHL